MFISDIMKTKKRKSTETVQTKQNLNIKHKASVYVNRPKKQKIKRRQYSPDNLKHAVEALKSGLSLRKAANAFGVPVVTLHRKKDNLDVNSKPGPSTVFTQEEEAKIVNWIIYRGERGYPVTKTELLDCVQKYVNHSKKATPFNENRPGRHWYEAFRKRHPELTIRTAQHLSLTRAAVTREDLMEWFQQIENYLQSNNLIHISPDRVFNCDETSMLLCPDSERVLTRRGVRAAYKVIDDRKESLTTLFTYSAAGTRVPPMLMFAYAEKVPKVIIQNTPKDWGIGISENGWTTAETFYEYVTNVFYPWLLKEGIEFPVILYLDNHSSHINIPLVHFCREKKIEIIAPPPNSTHIMQPLDIAYFHPLKEVWKKTVPQWKNESGFEQLKKENFPKVLRLTLDNFKNEKAIIVSGFKASGLAPFNRNAVDYDILIKRKKSKTSQKVTETENENEEPFVQLFEKNIPIDLLQAFKEALKNGAWTGNIEKKALFEYWLKINKKSIGIFN